MIEELTGTELSRLGNPDAPHRWKIDRGGPFGMLRLKLERKGRFFWGKVTETYPEILLEGDRIQDDEDLNVILTYTRELLVNRVVSQKNHQKTIDSYLQR